MHSTRYYFPYFPPTVTVDAPPSQHSNVTWRRLINFPREGTQGQIVGARDRLNGRRKIKNDDKKIGEEKSHPRSTLFFGDFFRRPFNTRTDFLPPPRWSRSRSDVTISENLRAKKRSVSGGLRAICANVWPRRIFQDGGKQRIPTK